MNTVKSQQNQIEKLTMNNKDSNPMNNNDDKNDIKMEEKEKENGSNGHSINSVEATKKYLLNRSQSEKVYQNGLDIVAFSIVNTNYGKKRIIVSTCNNPGIAPSLLFSICYIFIDITMLLYYYHKSLIHRIKYPINAIH